MTAVLQSLGFRNGTITYRSERFHDGRVWIGDRSYRQDGTGIKGKIVVMKEENRDTTDESESGIEILKGELNL